MKKSQNNEAEKQWHESALSKAWRYSAKMPVPGWIVATGKGLGVLILAYWSISLAWGGWRFVDRAGWIEHTRVIGVTSDGNWLTGEYRECLSNGPGSFLVCESENTAIGTAKERTFSVVFQGELSKDVLKDAKWQCKREPDSISCQSAP